MEYVGLICVLANPSVKTWVIWVLFNCGCIRVESSSTEGSRIHVYENSREQVRSSNKKFDQSLAKTDAQANKDPSSNKNFARSLARQLLERIGLNVQIETFLNPCSSEFASSVAFFE